MTPRRYKSSGGRDQLSLLPPSIEDFVQADNPVRAIDAYVNTLNLREMGFLHAGPSAGAGQPAYDPAQMLKLYLYGYQNQVRSSRRLERETHRNLEMIWLMEGLKPSFKTIADFRKDNAKALKKVARDFVLLCQELKLFGGELVAIDGSFFHANAAKASIHTQKKLDRQIAEIEEKITRYMAELDGNDLSDDAVGTDVLHKDNELASKLEALKAKQQEIEALKAELEASGESQISTTDKDARLLNKGNGTVAGYNVQTVVDARHKLIAASEVSNDGNDQHQLHPMALNAKEALGVDELEVLADTGYFDSAQLKACEDAGVTAYVPEPDKSAKTKAQGRLTRDQFTYDAALDAYQCPQGHWLGAQGGPYEKNGRLWTIYASRTAVCGACPQRAECLAKGASRRQLHRCEHEDVVARARARMKAAREKMRQRAGLVEHPFGTMKCRFGWLHFLVRGFAKVGGEWALMVTGYNLTRILNILGLEVFMEYCAKRQEMAAEAA